MRTFWQYFLIASLTTKSKPEAFDGLSQHAKVKFIKMKPVTIK